MRKTRHLAMQKFAEQKRQQREMQQAQMAAASWQPHAPPHEPRHMMEQEWTPKQSSVSLLLFIAFYPQMKSIYVFPCLEKASKSLAIQHF